MTENLNDFLLENVDNEPETEQIEFKGFKSPFVIKSLTATELKEIQKRHTRKVLNKQTRTVTVDSDADAISDDLIVSSIVVPDLNNAQLQKSWGVVANPGKLLRKMLLAGQYGKLAEKVQTLSGFDAEDLTSLVDEAKK